MLSKEECIKHCEIFEKIIKKDLSFRYIEGLNFEEQSTLVRNLKNVMECFEQLIEEHFDNEPLKWEELHEDMWVWCGGEYSQITELSDFGTIKLVYFDCDSVRFKEGRFYRKQVEE